MSETVQVASLEQLRRSAPWWWICCRNADGLHRSPVALVPYIIRWGPEASSDLLRNSARCERCGRS